MDKQFSCPPPTAWPPVIRCTNCKHSHNQSADELVKWLPTACPYQVLQHDHYGPTTQQTSATCLPLSDGIYRVLSLINIWMPANSNGLINADFFNCYFIFAVSVKQYILQNTIHSSQWQCLLCVFSTQEHSGTTFLRVGVYRRNISNLYPVTIFAINFSSDLNFLPVYILSFQISSFLSSKSIYNMFSNLDQITILNHKLSFQIFNLSKIISSLTIYAIKYLSNSNSKSIHRQSNQLFIKSKF